MKQTIIYGGPGCGKTWYLLNLLEKLLEDYKPSEIAFVSFTKKGAYEGRTRAMERFGYASEEFPYFRTLHSIAYAQAQLARDDIMGRKQYKQFSDLMNMNFTGYYTEDFNSDDDKYLFYYFLRKNNPKAAESCALDINMRSFEVVAKSYDAYKARHGYADFTDMISFFVESGQPVPVKIAIIDEAQDLTTLQWKMCEIAFGDCDHVYIAGDDDQAIYEWNGADVEHFLNLAGNKVVLEKSNRMPSHILNFSTHITDMMSQRVEKKFAPNMSGGIVYFHNSIEDIEIDATSSYYFLSRNNMYLKQYREMLRKRGFAYVDKTEHSVDEKVIRAINAYEQMRKTGNYKSEVDRLVTAHFLRNDMGNTEPWYKRFNLDIDDANYYRDLIAHRPNVYDRRLMINTIHGVKGGEADKVVVMLDVTKNVRDNYLKHEDSELRCLYVACTRAKKELHIVHSNSNYGYDNYMDVESFAEFQRPKRVYQEEFVYE